MKISKKVSLAAMLSALSVIMLLMGSFLETVTLSVAAIAAVCVSVAVIELGYGYSFLVYAATALIALLPLPSKEPLLYFLCFFGYYPIIKSLIEKLKTVFAYLLKGAALTAAYALTAFIGIKLFAPETDLIKYVFILFPIILAVFYAYDYALSKLMKYYVSSLRKRLGIDKFLN